MTDEAIDLSEFVTEDQSQQAYEPPPPAPVPGGQVQPVYVPATIYLKDGTSLRTEAWGYSPLGIYAGGTWESGHTADVLLPYEQVNYIEFHYESEAEDESSSS